MQSDAYEFIKSVVEARLPSEELPCLRHLFQAGNISTQDISMSMDEAHDRAHVNCAVVAGLYQMMSVAERRETNEALRAELL